MKDKFHLIKPVEAVIIGIVLLTAFAAIFITNLQNDSPQTAVISCGDIRREISLDRDGTFHFDGIDAEFEVKDGKIRITSATCPDKICEKTGFIGSGQTIICVPNKITVAVVGSDSSIDAAVG